MEKLKETKMYKKPKVKQKKSILVLAWIIPIIALVISFGMMKDYFDQKGQTITLYSKDVKGLNIRKSHIEYRGVHIGDLKSIKPDPHNLDQFIIKAQVYKEYNYLVKKGSNFWIVESTIGVDKIENIGTVLTGNYIELIPPTTNSYYLSQLPIQKSFNVLETKPHESGEKINLKSDNGDIGVSTKIAYKGIKVGEVIAKDLESEQIDYTLLIYDKYKYLLDDTTRFYIQKPLEFNFSKEGLQVELAPFKEMMFGSIVLVQDEKLISTNSKILHPTKNKLFYMKEEGFEIDLIGDSIKENQKVFYKGVEIGYVDSIDFVDKTKVAKLFIKNKYKNYVTNNSKFYKQSSIDAEVSFEGVNVTVGSLDEIVFGGIVLEYFKGNSSFKKQYKLYNSKREIRNEEEQKEVFEITVNVEDLGNIRTTSKLYFKNVQIGSVKDIKLENDKPQIILLVKNKYKHLFGRNAKIYLEGIQLSLSKFKNISLEVLGDKFMLVPSYDDGFKSEFMIDGLNPIETKYLDGKRFIIKSSNAKDLNINTPILYKYVKIGNIERIELDTRSDDINLHVYIQKEYAKYIHEDTTFYLDKVIDAKFGIFNSKVEFGSLKTLLNGGINIDIIDEKTKEDTAIENKDKNGFYQLLRSNPFIEE